MSGITETRHRAALEVNHSDNIQIVVDPAQQDECRSLLTEQGLPLVYPNLNAPTSPTLDLVVAERGLIDQS